MEKTDLMLKYEKETGETLDMAILAEDASGSWYGYIDMVDKKAAAYDRLMSGWKKTLKEWANWLGTNIAVDEKGNGCVSKNPLEFHPLGDGYKVAGYWTIRAGYSYLMFNIPAYLIEFNGDWTTSLTLPDNWEEKQC